MRDLQQENDIISIVKLFWPPLHSAGKRPSVSATSHPKEGFPNGKRNFQKRLGQKEILKLSWASSFFYRGPFCHEFSLLVGQPTAPDSALCLGPILLAESECGGAKASGQLNSREGVREVFLVLAAGRLIAQSEERRRNSLQLEKVHRCLCRRG